MKLIMINDCAFVGETLLKYMPPYIKKQHIKRNHGALGRTFGVTYDILKTRGDLYHVNYMLLECYVALKLGRHPLIAHAHGTDLREELRSKKLGWIVRYNLKNSDKVFVAQPTLLHIAKYYNETAEYFPIPFDPELFYPRSLPKEYGKKRIFLASAHDFRIKGTDKFLRALALTQKPFKVITLKVGKDFRRALKLSRELCLEIELINRVPHNRINELYWNSNLVLGSFGIGQLDTVAIEAMACGRPVVHSISKKFYSTCPLEELTSVNEASELITRLLTDEKERERRIKTQLNYVKKIHIAPILAKRAMKVYKEMMGN